MATPSLSTITPSGLGAAPTEPILEAGDRLTRDEFERRYTRLPHLKKAELIEGIVSVEIFGSSRAYDLHQKKAAYLRNGVREYLAWITSEERLVWWELRNAEYREISAAPDGLLKSGVFPGLWLDASALLRGDMREALSALRRGLDSAEHTAALGTDCVRSMNHSRPRRLNALAAE